jgi:hypothetical protein
VSLNITAYVEELSKSKFAGNKTYSKNADNNTFYEITHIYSRFSLGMSMAAHVLQLCVVAGLKH